MTDEQINIAIAEYRGWQILEPEVHRAITYHWAIEPDSSKSILPDCCNDLNAMHDAESILNADQMVSYDYHLDRVVGNGRQGLNIEYFLWSATASQRAEAFVKTIGKWKE